MTPGLVTPLPIIKLWSLRITCNATDKRQVHGQSLLPTHSTTSLGTRSFNEECRLFTCVCCARPALGDHGYDLEDSRPIQGQQFPTGKFIITITGTWMTEKCHCLGNSQCAFKACNGHALGKEGRGRIQDEVRRFVEGRFWKCIGSAKADQGGAQVSQPQHV